MAPDQESELARFWWLKRISLAFAVVVLLMLGIWLAQDRYAAKTLRAQLDLYAAAGEPVALSDIATPSFTEEHNAAAIFQSAASKVSANTAKSVWSPRSSNIEYDHEMPPTPEWMAMTQRAMQANAEALKLVPTALQYRRADWGVQLTSPMMMVMLPHLAPQRELANLLADAAIYEHALGNERQALALYRLIQHQANALCQDPLLISRLMGIGIEELGDSAIAQVAGELRIEDGSEGSLTRDEVRQLITELLQRPRRDLRPAMQVERVYQLDTYEVYFSRRYTTRPLHQLDVPFAMQWTDRLMEQCQAPTLAHAISIPPALVPDSNRWASGRTSVPPSQALRPVRDIRLGLRVLGPPFRALMTNRVIAIQLAARLYALDKAVYPPTLEELVPEYLPYLPDDPLSGAPFRYVFLAEGKRPMLVSQGTDPQEQLTPVDIEPWFQWYWQAGKTTDNTADTWFDLSAWKSGEKRIWEDPQAMPDGWQLPDESVEEGDQDTDDTGEERQDQQR